MAVAAVPYVHYRIGMFTETEVGWRAGPLDVISIVKDSSTGRFHVYVLYESPLPGHWGVALDDLIRLKSKMHHTKGADSYEEALTHLRKTRSTIDIPDENVWSRLEQVLEADCSGGFAGIFFTRPWKGCNEMPKLLLPPD